LARHRISYTLGEIILLKHKNTYGIIFVNFTALNIQQIRN
jgi:hypothetical protein